MSNYVTNAFSLSMISGKITNLSIKELNVEEVKKFINENEVISAVGHQDTSTILSNMLGKEVKYNRTSILLEEGDRVIVAQFMGGRLPEGTTELPPDYKFKFMLVQNNGDMNEYCRQTLNGLNTSMDGFSLLFSAEAIEDKIKI